MLKFLCVAFVPLVLVSGEYLYADDHYNYNSEYASAYDNYKPRDYKFEYGVSDPHTGDHKSQWEVRENGVVRGAYSLLEADGTTRVVEYYADDTGFHADVKKIGHAIHTQPEYHSTPIIKTHLADSIAYNGYGHGGLEHSYGAPIAAVQHVAPVIAAPIEHIAPIAQVQHIEPVKQVIAPQLLERYAPAHYSYAPEPIQHYAEPIHFHQASEVHIPKIAQIQQYEHIQQAPINLQHAPIHLQQKPIHFQEAPIHLHEEPIHLKQAPIHIQQAPVHLEQAPIHLKQTPIHIQEASAYLEQAPIHLKQAPIHLQGEPNLLKQIPIHLQQVPIHIQQAQLHLEQAPIHLKQQPIHVSEPIQHYAPELHVSKEQVHFQPEVGYAKLAEPIQYQAAPEVRYSKIPVSQIQIKSQPIQHYAPANYLEAPQYAEPIHFKQESYEAHQNQYPVAPASYVEQKLIQAPQQAYYENVQKPNNQEYSQLSQIDQAILKYLASQQHQQQRNVAPQSTRSYGFNHGL